ncbi:heterokaryon incompatibility protein-domain-containing protein [Cadophora sp. MPI-SDFR-AT-0126]|nr:heterokaryon incompatibility protein-domain-containing protein [Leotiomycetes sp. MPI-SDFR-AT-0126]
MTVSFPAQRSQNLPQSDAKRLTPEIADAYFSRDTLENHRQEYNREREYWRKLAEETRLQRKVQEENRQTLADERRLQRKVQEVQSRLLGASTPAAAKVQDELEVAQDVLPHSPKPKAVDFDLLERLLPGCRLKDSKDFSRPSDATMYEPLPGPGWFRLLVIEPWCADNDKLRCNLRAVRLDDAAGRYSALSYCWTQPVRDAVHGLLCNGLAIDVGENLRLALENIRYRTLPRIVWVDALCINQDDLAERNQQVQLMGQIYQQAIEAIVWLGDSFPRRPPWPEFDAICKVVKKWDKSLRPYYESRNEKGKLCRTEPGISRNQSSWDASLVSRFFGCPWFERRWVIQEVALAPSAVVKAPGATIQWKWIGLAAGIIRTNHDQLISSYQMPNVYNAYLISRLSSHGPLPPLDVRLLSLLRLTTGFKTAEKLDVVFALLGFLNRQGESFRSRSPSGAVRVDYNLSESELGILVAESHMAQSRRPLSFLSDAVGIPEKPTWSPRWTHKMASMLDPWSLNDDTDAFNPAKGLSFKRFQPTRPDQLNVEGVRLSQVAWRTAMFGSPEDFNAIMADLIQMLHRCQGGWDIWNASAMPAVARTFCGERDRYGGRAKDLDHLATQLSDFIRTWLRCHPDYFPELSQVLNIEKVYSEGDGMTWVDAAEAVCLGRCLFYTTSGHIGLGPGDMALGDVVCILGGTVMPIVVRPLEDQFGIVGDCYVNGVMDGEAVSDMVQGRILHGPIPVDDADRQAQSRYEPLQLTLMSLC